MQADEKVKEEKFQRNTQIYGCVRLRRRRRLAQRCCTEAASDMTSSPTETEDALMWQTNDSCLYIVACVPSPPPKRSSGSVSARGEEKGNQRCFQLQADLLGAESGTGR